MTVMLDPETPITVRRHWNDWKQGTVPFRCLDGLHYGSTSGGVGVASPRPMLMGYIRCTDLTSGEIAHTCQHGPPPHRIKVTIVQKDNDRSVVAALKAVVAERGRP
ncbi:hypothetical protein MKK75_11050 [Methylobacterium sp. J-030]|uniref:hypothetical protein n=1 Tax=Methylobacterium sp. J-030 TaxID=2836627 RepID=UPI001FB8CF20|nr:hypothetical protein [Methylobacterium sp. J-030]MCJ2069331.1 hypothetical protein [Methylobacterium sp. J-030]